MSRSRILHRVRSAIEQANAPTLPAEIPALPEYSDPVGQFIQQAELIGVQSQRLQDPASLAEAFRGVLLEAGAEDLFWESPEIFEHHQIPHRFRDPAGFGSGKLVSSFHFRAKVELPFVLNTRPFKRSSLAAIELVVLHAQWGIAETGTLGLQVGPGKSRTLPILPPKVLILVRAADIDSNLSQVLGRYDPSEWGSILTLVSGPSRTADIEKMLVIGVHGPKQVYLFVTEFDSE